MKSSQSGAGFAGAAGESKSSLRATSAAVRALKYFGGKTPNVDKCRAFVTACHDKASGGNKIDARVQYQPDGAIRTVTLYLADWSTNPITHQPMINDATGKPTYWQGNSQAILVSRQDGTSRVYSANGLRLSIDAAEIPGQAGHHSSSMLVTLYGVDFSFDSMSCVWAGN